MEHNGLGDTSALNLTRRGVLGLGAALGVGAAVSACGGGSSTPPGAGAGANIGEGAYEGEKVTLAFWNGFTGGDGAFMKEMVKTFNTETENIEVQMNTLEWGDFYSKVPNAVASGAGPDVAAMHVDQVGTNAARRVIMSLDDFTGPMELQEDDFAETVWKAGIYDGQRYAIPLDVHPLAFYYNNKLLQQGGVSEPPKDRESWEAALTGMKSKGVEYPFWATATWPAHLIFISLLGQFGGSLYDEEAAKATFASAEGVEALEWYASHVEKGFSPKNVANDAQAQAFRQGRDAMTWDGIWMMNEWAKVQGLDWGASPLPQIGDEPAVWASSHQLVIMQQRQADENKLHAARDFIKYLSDNSIEWAKSGQIPARNSVRESDEFAALEVQSTLAEQLDYVIFPPTVPGIGDVTAPTFEQAVNTVVLGKADAKTALEDAAKKADALLEDNRKKYSA
ncbi:MAG: ABC transporter, sugar binding protein [uncultured Frankineae bacterium]|uniref:ABC transporter, sugar binding protein n=1 Tax=uncultured Frankineae bacterium TaxID=437475 RepID=A0A6J4KI30_9ACTN|nr:MAG: ABC transporter, sugar binding protein [uncultured Frankineae bacterium]